MFDITILFVSKKSSKVKWILSPWNYTNVIVLIRAPPLPVKQFSFR
jgi:hypothetical protein